MLKLKLFKHRKAQTDQELLTRFVNGGDKSAFGELFERYSTLVFGICIKYLKHAQESQDAVMEIFEKLMIKPPEAEVQNFKAWLYQVTKNHCLMHLRKGKGKENQQADLEKIILADIMENQGNNHLNNGDELNEARIQKLEQAMTQLIPDQKRCMELFYLQKKSYKEIVLATGFPEKTVKSHLQNGKRNLKKMMLPIWIFIFLI